MIFTLRMYVMIVLGLSVAGCTAKPVRNEASLEAGRIFNMRCITAGEKIIKTVDGVDGIFIMKMRPEKLNFNNQFVLDDPYGSDLTGIAYLKTFLREFYDVEMYLPVSGRPKSRSSLYTGYQFVEAVDEKNGVRYRYTGRLEEPWKTNKNYLRGYIRFALDTQPATGPSPRYGITYDDISTTEDRKYWVAGSSLKVVDLKNGEIIAERVGYMYDPAQGSEAGGRSPWLLAANHACPSFGETYHNASFQPLQAIRFVEKVLHPKKDAE